MELNPPLQQGILLKRYKRFLADVELSEGQIITVHCPNTGSMKNCVVPGTACWFSLSDNPKRKLPGTLEITTTPSGCLAGVNTARTNQLVREAIEAGRVPELNGYTGLKPEVRYGDENSRIDLLLTAPDRAACYVEVKNTTLEAGGGLVTFPDAVTARGAKHLRELIKMVAAGNRAVLFFCVQHTGAERAGPADDVDPEYGRLLREAMAAGVEVLAYACRLSAREIALDRPVPFVL